MYIFSNLWQYCTTFYCNFYTKPQERGSKAKHFDTASDEVQRNKEIKSNTALRPFSSARDYHPDTRCIYIHVHTSLITPLVNLTTTRGQKFPRTCTHKIIARIIIRALPISSKLVLSLILGGVRVKLRDALIYRFITTSGTQGMLSHNIPISGRAARV